MADVLLNKVYLFLTKCSVVWLFVDYHQFKSVNEECLWIMAVEWFYLLLKPLVLALVDHVVFTCFQVSTQVFNIYDITSLFF